MSLPWKVGLAACAISWSIHLVGMTLRGDVARLSPMILGLRTFELGLFTGALRGLAAAAGRRVVDWMSRANPRWWRMGSSWCGPTRRPEKRARPQVPPSTGSTCPVIQPAWAEARNITAFAISSGSPSRRMAMRSSSAFWPASP